MENELLENFVIKINDLQKEINKKYEKSIKKAKIITNPIHLKLEAPHPSPLSAHRGFFGCKHFSKTNEFLISHGIKPINWQIGE